MSILEAFNLEGKVALVTGANRGLVERISQQLFPVMNDITLSFMTCHRCHILGHFTHVVCKATLQQVEQQA